MKSEAGMVPALMELTDQREWETVKVLRQSVMGVSPCCALDLSFLTSSLIVIPGKAFSFR